MRLTTYAELAKHLPAPLYKAVAQTWLDPAYPRHLFIEITSSCNLVCTFCPRERRGDHMDFALFTAIVDEASRYGPRSFSLHLFGEPTLYPKWQEAIRYIKTKNKRHTVLLTTNGTTLNAKVDAVIASGVDKVIWTWRPEVLFTDTTLERLRRWGKFQVRILEEVTPTDEVERWKTWRPLEIKRLHNYGGHIATDKFGTKTDGSTSATPAVRWPCYHLWLAPAIAWNGKILLCCADPHQEETLGTFPQMSVGEAWRSERLNAIREGHLKGEYRGLCKGCNVWATYPNMFFGHEYPNNLPA